MPAWLVMGSVAVAALRYWFRNSRPRVAGARAGATGQTAFDHAQPGAPPRSRGIGEARSDRELFEEVSAPAGYGPAPGGYGPASTPAGAHGGSGIFGAEGAGGGPGNDAKSVRQR